MIQLELEVISTLYLSPLLVRYIGLIQNFVENFNISESNIISVKAAKVLWWVLTFLFGLCLHVAGSSPLGSVNSVGHDMSQVASENHTIVFIDF